MDATNRPLNALDPEEVDSYIDTAIDQLFVPRSAPPNPHAAASAEPAEVQTEDQPDPPTGSTVPELELLQEILLSLEWEVSERNIEDFQSEIRAVGQRFNGNRHVAAVVQMALGVGKYLMAVGESASPLAVQFPSATLRTLEILLREPPPDSTERKAAVEQLLESYRRLQAEVRRQPARPAQTAPAAPTPREETIPAAQAESIPAQAPATTTMEPAAATDLEEPESETVEGSGAVPERQASAEANEFEATGVEGIAAETPGTPRTLEAEAPDTPAGELSVAQEHDPEPLLQEYSADTGETVAPVAGESAPVNERGKVVPLSSDGLAESSEAAQRLVACLRALRNDVREGLQRTFRAATSGTEELDAELTQFGHLLDEGIASALDLTESLPPQREETPEQPAPPGRLAGRLAAGLEQVRLALEGLSTSVREMERQLVEGVSPMPAQRAAAAAATAERQAGTPPPAPDPGPPGPAESQVYLISVCGRPSAIPAHLVANAFPITKNLAGRIRERGYATLRDFRRPFRGLKKGLAGPLAALGGKELERLRFPLPPESAVGKETPGGAVLLSDGRTHAVLLTDALLDRTPRTAPEDLLFHLRTPASSQEA
ncbi:MAG: hypothetical protein IH608_12995 [Proteobacteria bacterium]|nr:hypothetical protein [Pseudomonadota bacterium]